MPEQTITGYRQLTDAELALINEIKATGEQLRDLVHRVHVHIDAQPADDAPPSTITDPHRWASIATTNLQQGLMALTRAVGRSTTF